jgi:hypothetical protein
MPAPTRTMVQAMACLGGSTDLDVLRTAVAEPRRRSSRRPRPPAMLRSISTTSVAIELDQPLVADPEVMRDLVEYDVPDLAA